MSPAATLAEAARLLRQGAATLRAEAEATSRPGLVYRLLLRASLYEAGARACGLLAAEGVSAAEVGVEA